MLNPPKKMSSLDIFWMCDDAIYVQALTTGRFRLKSNPKSHLIVSNSCRTN